MDCRPRRRAGVDAGWRDTHGAPPELSWRAAFRATAHLGVVWHRPSADVLDEPMGCGEVDVCGRPDCRSAAAQAGHRVVIFSLLGSDAAPVLGMLVVKARNRRGRTESLECGLPIPNPHP